MVIVFHFQLETTLVTCMRGSAKQHVKNNSTFLWEQVIFRHQPNENSLTDRYEILNILSRWETTKCVKNGDKRLTRGGTPQT
jgi:hypothetical protein